MASFQLNDMFITNWDISVYKSLSSIEQYNIIKSLDEPMDNGKVTIVFIYFKSYTYVKIVSIDFV